MWQAGELQGWGVGRMFSLGERRDKVCLCWGGGGGGGGDAGVALPSRSFQGRSKGGERVGGGGYLNGQTPHKAYLLRILAAWGQRANLDRMRGRESGRHGTGGKRWYRQAIFMGQSVPSSTQRERERERERERSGQQQNRTGW